MNQELKDNGEGTVRTSKQNVKAQTNPMMTINRRQAKNVAPKMPFRNNI